MTKILYSSASPYSAKARMAATYAGVSFESVAVNPNDKPELLIENNPLGKIPVLVTDEGDAVFDSRAITQYLNRASRNALFPRNAQKRLEAERLEALGDGLCDCLLAHVYERRFRPEENVEQSWLDAQWEKSERVLDQWQANPPKLPKKINAGHLAVRAALGYLVLRFPGKWERGRPKLTRWIKRFDEKFPDVARFAPQ